MPSSSSPGAKQEYPTIREQDLALILADWVRLMTGNTAREADALDFSSIVGDLAVTGLHAASLSVIHQALPETPQWQHLRERIEKTIVERKIEEFEQYPERQLPVF